MTKLNKEEEIRKEWKPFKKTHYIKVKNPPALLFALQNWLIGKNQTNAGLISTQLHFKCRKFIKELEEIPLSEELQGRFIKNKRIR